MKLKKVAFVIQRYGEEIIGGSETLAREIAERLSDVYDIEIITTCAKDYWSWNNEYPQGLSHINGVKVRRFKTDRSRDKNFNKYYESILQNKNRSILDEIEWMNKQGPFSSELLAYLRYNHQKYNLIVFFTYIYFNCYYGIQIAPEKSILIPTAHDEPPIYFDIFNTVFYLPKGIIFLTEEEKIFVQNRFKGLKSKLEVIGMGIDQGINVVDSQQNFKDLEKPYILYMGRIDYSKKVDQLIDYFIKFKKDNKIPELKLYLAGKSNMKIPKRNDIQYLGFIEDKHKMELISNAFLFVLPSQFESFSISTLEAMYNKVPVLVNGKCKVLKGHVRRSNAGLYYENYREFEQALLFLYNNKDVYEVMRINGERYVKENYDWNVIKEKYTTFFYELIRD